MSAFRAFPRVSRLSVLLLVALVAVLATAPKGEGSHLPNVVAIVPVGAHARSVAVNPATNRIYVGNFDNDTVSVVDGSGNTVTATVAVGDGPESVAVNSSTNRIYTANRGGNSVSVIDGATNTVLTTIAIPGVASGLAVNSSTNRIYVGNWTTDSVEVINGATNGIIANVGLPPGADPHSLGIAVNETTNRIYVSNYDDPGVGTTVSVIDGGTNSEIAQVTVGVAPSGLAVNASTNRIYVMIAGALKVIDGSSNSVVATVPLFGTGGGGVSVDPTLNQVYVTRELAARLQVIDGDTNSEVTTVSPLSNFPFAIASNSATGRVYPLSWSSNKLTVLSFPVQQTSAPTGPNLVSFQGRLTDSGGNPVADGNYSIKFRIYDAAAGGNLQWEETQTVAVAGSVFSVQLGAATPLAGGVFAGDPRYLEVQVESDPALTPRQRFTTVPYSVNAQSLDGLGAADFTNRDLVVLLVGSAQSCPTGFTFLMSVNAGVNGTDAAKACQSQSASQLFYIGSTQTCPTGWTQVDINAAVSGTSPADACYR